MQTLSVNAPAPVAAPVSVQLLPHAADPVVLRQRIFKLIFQLGAFRWRLTWQPSSQDVAGRCQ